MHDLTTSDDDALLYNPGLPVVAFRLSDDFKKSYPHVKQQSVSTLLRAKQYIIPNYALPPSEQDTEILRVVVRESMSADLLDRLIGDILEVTETLMKSDAVDLEAFSSAQSPRTEKEHQSMGHHGAKKRREAQEKRREKGILRSTC
jgi:glutamate decarboxylase